VVVLGLVLVLLGLWFRGGGGDRLPYIVASDVPVTGLIENSTVYYRGVPAGKVEKISLAPHDSRRILIKVALDRSVPVTAGTYGRLRSQLVTGNAQLVLDSRKGQFVTLKTSSGHPATIPLLPSLLDSLGEVAPELVSKLTRLVDDLSRVFTEPNAEHVSNILANAERTTRELDALLAENRGGVRQALREARRTMAEVRAAVVALRQVAGTAQRAARSAGRLGETGEATIRELRDTTLPRVHTAVDQLEAAARSVAALAESLRQNPQRLLQGQRGTPPGPGEPGYKAARR